MALELLSVDHRYGRHRSLEDVTLTLRPGDCYGFIGHNGAGKTTALRIALGLDRPQRGQVRIDGIDALRSPRAARARVGGTIETVAFYPWVSARENLAALARVQGMNRNDARKDAERVLERVGLAEVASRRVGTFSQGMRQRLGIAQAILGRPRYVLLDEPHNGLDPESIAALRQLLLSLTSEDDGAGPCAVLVSSHQLLEVSELCNRIGVLRAGRLLLEQDTAELLRASRGRFTLSTDDAAGTERVLSACAISHQRAEVGGGSSGPRFDLDLGTRNPTELVRQLVAADVGVEELSPQRLGLEEVYLQIQKDPPSAQATAPAPADPAPAQPSATPRGGFGLRPLLRICAHDLRRHGSRPILWAIAALPALLAWRRIADLAVAAQRNQDQVTQGELFSTSLVTAWEALARGIAAGLPALTLIAVAFGSQAIAGDWSQGTLRNLLLRPVRRRDLLLGKSLAVASALTAALLALIGTATFCAAGSFEFGDRMEIYRDAEPELWIEAAEIVPDLPIALLSPVLPVLAYGGLGVLLGVLVRRSLWALAAAVGCALALDLARALARRADLEGLLLSAHQPSPLGDSSFLAYFVDLAVGNAEAFYPYGDMLWVAPATWGASSLALAALLLARQRIP